MWFLLLLDIYVCGNFIVNLCGILNFLRNNVLVFFLIFKFGRLGFCEENKYFE